jgi:cell wall assembly regulator SMI1
MSHPTVDAVIAYWDKNDVWYLPGVNEEELAQFEMRYRVHIPTEMRSFYKATDGTRVPLSTGEDHKSYSFWRLSEIEPDSHDNWLMNFADYLIMSWWYAIDLTGRGQFGRGAIYFMGAVGGEPLIVAHSFSEFLSLYVCDDRRLSPKGALAYHDKLLGR